MATTITALIDEAAAHAAAGTPEHVEAGAALLTSAMRGLCPHIKAQRNAQALSYARTCRVFLDEIDRSHPTFYAYNADSLRIAAGLAHLAAGRVARGR